jgi:hypothetical protein
MCVRYGAFLTGFETGVNCFLNITQRRQLQVINDYGAKIRPDLQWAFRADPRLF